PPRLPTASTRACGQCSSTAGLTRSSVMTICAWLSALTALRVSNSGSPGPAPTSQTFAFIVCSSCKGICQSGADCQCLAGQQALDFWNTGAALATTAQLFLQFGQLEAVGNALYDRGFTDVAATAQGVAQSTGRIAGRGAQRGQEPAPQLRVGLTAVPQAFQPVPGSSLAGQTDGVDTSLLDTYTLPNPAPRVVIGQNGALLQLQALIE